jgi:hypothetical protein
MPVNSEAARLAILLRPLPRLAQNEELRCSGREARSVGRMGQKNAVMGPQKPES